MSEISRRSLLGAGAFALVLGPLTAPAEASAGTATTGAAAVTRRRARNLYTRARFAAVRKQRFHLTGPGLRRAVRLTGIDNLSSRNRGDEHRFALTFRATKAGPPQGTYTLRRRGFAATPLFLVPDAARRTYVAVVNQAG
jgi:hypothetical protein